MSNVKGRPTEAIPLHRVLREVYRHFLEYRDHVASTGDHVIEHGYYTYEDDGVTIKSKETVTISFWDLHTGVKELAPRKKEAFFHNVILDKKQKDVADIMGITTVSVGQYVEQAVQQLALRYFAEVESKDSNEDLEPQERGTTVKSSSVQPPKKSRRVEKKEVRKRGV